QGPQEQLVRLAPPAPQEPLVRRESHGKAPGATRPLMQSMMLWSSTARVISAFKPARTINPIPPLLTGACWLRSARPVLPEPLARLVRLVPRARPGPLVQRDPQEQPDQPVRQVRQVQQARPAPLVLQARRESHGKERGVIRLPTP